MPIYEYRCKQCNAKQELLQHFDDPAPICGCGHEMEKIISTSNFHLKGNGWACDNYSNKKPNTEKNNDNSVTEI